ncbi:dioxygenase [Streptomyces sp. NPDC014724]|uniref:dioxygenase n=1 Tax=unclassified Streptomyces TaxID=2593676 RepID=UPI0036F56325
MTETQGPAHKKDMSRRRVVLAGGAVIVAAGIGADAVASASADEDTTGAEKSGGEHGEACYRLTSETTRDGGTPPTDVPTGPPPSGGPGGGHSEPTDDERYLRGTQLTDKHGYVEFKTIFPGWYQGRCVHIHTKVHVGGKMTDAGYEGGHTCHTGQFFFAESAVLDSAKIEPYSTSTTTRTTLTEDTVYDQSGVTGGLMKLSYRKRHMARGVVGLITMGVDPDETHDGTDL